MNLDQALPQSHLPCRAPFCPRQGEPWPEPVSGTSMGWMCSQSCYPLQSGSSQGHRSPYPPPPMNIGHGSLLHAWALTGRSDRTSSALSVDEDGHYPPVWSFRLWWILEHSDLQCQRLAFTREALNESNLKVYGLCVSSELFYSINICVQHTHNNQIFVTSAVFLCRLLLGYLAKFKPQTCISIMAQIAVHSKMKINFSSCILNFLRAHNLLKLLNWLGKMELLLRKTKRYFVQSKYKWNVKSRHRGLEKWGQHSQSVSRPNSFIYIMLNSTTVTSGTSSLKCFDTSHESNWTLQLNLQNRYISDRNPTTCTAARSLIVRAINQVLSYESLGWLN